MRVAFGSLSDKVGEIASLSSFFERYLHHDYDCVDVAGLEDLICDDIASTLMESATGQENVEYIETDLSKFESLTGGMSVLKDVISKM